MESIDANVAKGGMVYESGHVSKRKPAITAVLCMASIHYTSGTQSTTHTGTPSAKRWKGFF